MKNALNSLERDIVASARRQLGRKLACLMVIGSRANGDAEPDSDFDGFAFQYGKKKRGVGFPGLERKYGIRIGVSSQPMWLFRDWVKNTHPGPCRRNTERLISMRLGRARRLWGRDLQREIPGLRTLLARDLMRELQDDYLHAIDPRLPTYVYRREPRRHVGIIIAMCDAVLLARGIAVNKADLPAALRKHCPRFRVVALLRRALWRRMHWEALAKDRPFLRAVRADLDRFLAAERKYLHIDDLADLRGRAAAIRYWHNRW